LGQGCDEVRQPDGFFLCQVYWKLQDSNPALTKGKSVLDGIARPELMGTTCVERTRLLDIVIRILDEAKIVRLALRNEPYAAQDVVPVYPRREFIAISCMGSCERADADVIKEHTEINRFRTGRADDPRDAVN
jgi:hypothetical protein